MEPRIYQLLLMIRKACGFEMLYQEARARKEGLRERASEEVVSITLIKILQTFSKDRAVRRTT
jgi:hypothetical protein